MLIVLKSSLWAFGFPHRSAGTWIQLVDYSCLNVFECREMIFLVVIFRSRKKEKSQGFKSGELWGWGATGMFLLAKNSIIEITVIKRTFVMQYLMFGAWPFFKNLCKCVHWPFDLDAQIICGRFSNYRKSMHLIFDLLILTSWDFGEVEVCHSMLLQPSLVTSNDTLQEMWIIYVVSKKSRHLPMSFWSSERFFWKHFCVEFSHLQFISQNLMNDGACQM